MGGHIALEKTRKHLKMNNAGMAELVDALDLGSSELARAGSSPVLGISLGFQNYPRNPLINKDLQRKIGSI